MDIPIFLWKDICNNIPTNKIFQLLCTFPSIEYAILPCLSQVSLQEYIDDCDFLRWKCISNQTPLPKVLPSSDEQSAALRNAATRGDLHLCRLLVEKLNICELSDGDNHPLKWAARRGRVEVCEYLIHAFAITKEVLVLKEELEDVLTWSLLGGDLQMCSWLVCRLGLTELDISLKGPSLKYLAKKGLLRACKWLVSYSNDIKDIKETFTKVVERGHFDVCKWMVNFSSYITSDDAFNNVYLLGMAAL